MYAANATLLDPVVAIDTTANQLCPSTIVYTFTATDKDYGINAAVEYEFSNTTDHSTFTLHKNGSLGVKTKMDIDDKETYSLLIMAKDKGKPPLSTSLPVNVILLNINDNPPTFSTTQITLHVEENQLRDIGNVTAQDPDGSNGIRYSISGGTYLDHFKINDVSGSITVTKPLDHETVTNVKLTVEARDLMPVPDVTCDGNTKEHVFNKTSVTVNVNVIDVNDNPPIFTTRVITRGIRKTNTKIGAKVVDLKTFVTDADSAENSRHSFYMNGPIQTDATTPDACASNIMNTFVLNTNGSVLTNMLFQDDCESSFNLPVLVNDTAGNSTALVKINLILDSQIGKMVFFGNKQSLQDMQEQIMDRWSRITNHEFVPENIETHSEPDGTIDVKRSDQFFYVKEPLTGRILSSEEIQRLVDKHLSENYDFEMELRKEGFIEIQKAVSEPNTGMDNSTRTRYALIGVVVVLGIIMCVTFFLFWNSSNRYKRRLKAAKLTTGSPDTKEQQKDILPGSNKYSQHVNPVFNKNPAVYDEINDTDRISLNSIDSNNVGPSRGPLKKSGLEEKEVTLDMYGEDDYDVIKKVDPLRELLHSKDLQTECETNQFSDEEDIRRPVEVYNFDYGRDGDMEATDI
ncbi:hypothetical protein ScPMuIL_003712 [Solemya velum]